MNAPSSHPGHEGINSNSAIIASILIHVNNSKSRTEIKSISFKIGIDQPQLGAIRVHPINDIEVMIAYQLLIAVEYYLILFLLAEIIGRI